MQKIKENSENNNYQPILQGVPINSLFTVFDTTPSFDRFTNSADFTINNVQIKIKNFQNFILNNTIFRVFDYILLKMTKLIPYNKIDFVTDNKLSNVQIVKATLADFMHTCNLSNHTKARTQFLDALQFFEATSLHWAEPLKRKKKVERIDFDSRIISAFKPVRGAFLIQFDLKFLRYLSSFAYIMPYPIKILSVDFKHNPHAFLLARKLALHLNMNYGKTNSNIISVKTLLEALPDLPKYHEVLNKGKHVKQLIIEPFERDLDYLVKIGILQNWHYTAEVNYRFKKWKTLSLEFYFIDYPTRNKDK